MTFQHEYLSILMGARTVSDEDLNGLGVEIVQQRVDTVRCLRIPAQSLERYKDIVARKLEPGYWNDIIGESEILFIFKFPDGTVREITYSSKTEAEIASICSVFNGDPIEKTADIARCLASVSFYRDALVKWHGVTI